MTAALGRAGVAVFDYVEKRIEWQLIKATATSHRLVIESSLLPDSQLPLGIFITMTDAQAARGDWRLHAGWLTGMYVCNQYTTRTLPNLLLMVVHCPVQVTRCLA